MMAMTVTDDGCDDKNPRLVRPAILAARKKRRRWRGTRDYYRVRTGKWHAAIERNVSLVDEKGKSRDMKF